MAHNVLDSLPFQIGQTASGQQTLSSPLGDGSRVAQIPTNPLYDDDGTNALLNTPAVATFYRPDLADRIVTIRDTHPPVVGGTTLTPSGGPLLLRCVQLLADYTPTLAAAGLEFDTSSGRYGIVAKAATSTAGTVVGKPLHIAYATGVTYKKGDWVYVVEEGLSQVPIASGATVTAGKEARMTATGTFEDATDQDNVAGTWQKVPGSTAAATTGLLRVKRGVTHDFTGK
jgi:hypothetical protein